MAEVIFGGSAVIEGTRYQANMYATVPVVDAQNYLLTKVLSDKFLGGQQGGTIPAQIYQDLVVDATYGSVSSGSVIAAVIGVDPQTGVQTGTIVAGTWYGGGSQVGQRLQAAGPLGDTVAVVVSPALGGTIGAGHVHGVYLSAEQSTGP